MDNEPCIPLYFNAIQDLILYSMIGHYSPYVPQKWFKLDKYNNISHTIVFIIEGLTVNHYISNKTIFQHITSKLDYKLEISATDYERSFLEELINLPLSKTQITNLIKKFGSLKTAIKYNTDIQYYKTIFPIQSCINMFINI
jgi:RNA exonuclease 1